MMDMCPYMIYEINDHRTVNVYLFTQGLTMSQGLRHSTQVQSQMVMEMHGVEQQKMTGLTMVWGKSELD